MTGYFIRIKRDKVQPEIGVLKGRVEIASKEGVFNAGRVSLPTEMYLGLKALIDYKRTEKKIFIRIDMKGLAPFRKNYLDNLKKVTQRKYSP